MRLIVTRDLEIPPWNYPLCRQLSESCAWNPGFMGLEYSRIAPARTLRTQSPHLNIGAYSIDT